MKTIVSRWIVFLSLVFLDYIICYKVIGTEFSGLLFLLYCILLVVIVAVIFVDDKEDD